MLKSNRSLRAYSNQLNRRTLYGQLFSQYECPRSVVDLLVQAVEL